VCSATRGECGDAMALYDEAKGREGRAAQGRTRAATAHSGTIRCVPSRREVLAQMSSQHYVRRFRTCARMGVRRAGSTTRDLVRRAILARLCLAAQPDSLWPFDADTAVDAILADDAQRAAWRAPWHERLAALGVEYAAGPPRSASTSSRRRIARSSSQHCGPSDCS
jgi:hypothetical protein